MQRLAPGQVALKQRRRGGGQGGQTVLVPLARTDGQLFHRKINVLAPEPDGFHDTETAAVEQFGHQLDGVLRRRGDRGDFFAVMTTGTLTLLSAHGIDAVRRRLAGDAFVEKHQGIHRRVLGSVSDISMHRRIGEEGFKLGFGGEKAVTRPYTLETDEPYDPIRIQALGVHGSNGAPRAPGPSA
jgi:hypothetical protein